MLHKMGDVSYLTSDISYLTSPSYLCEHKISEIVLIFKNA